MKNEKLYVSDDIILLSDDELINTNAGFMEIIIAIGIVAGAVYTVYSCGAAAGKILYYATH